MTSSQAVSVDLAEVLSSLTGRRVLINDIIAALNLGRSTYYEQRDDGRLISADNMLRVATHMDINPVELLVNCGLISRRAVEDYLAGTGAAQSKTARQPRTRRFQRRADAPPL